MFLFFDEAFVREEMVRARDLFSNVEIVEVVDSVEIVCARLSTVRALFSEGDMISIPSAAALPRPLLAGPL